MDLVLPNQPEEIGDVCVCWGRGCNSLLDDLEVWFIGCAILLFNGLYCRKIKKDETLRME
jgi:hypothetical protein